MNVNKFKTRGTVGSSRGASRLATQLLAVLALVAIGCVGTSLLASSNAEAKRSLLQKAGRKWNKFFFEVQTKQTTLEKVPKGGNLRKIENGYLVLPPEGVIGKDGLATSDDVSHSSPKQGKSVTETPELVKKEDIKGNEQIFTYTDRMQFRSNGKKVLYWGLVSALPTALVAGATVGGLCLGGQLDTMQCSSSGNFTVGDLGRYIEFSHITATNTTVSGADLTGNVKALAGLADDAAVTISAQWGTNQSADTKTYPAAELRKGIDVTIPVAWQMEPGKSYNDVAFVATVTQGDNGGSVKSKPAEFVTLVNPVPGVPTSSQPERNGVKYSATVQATLDSKGNSGHYRYWVGKQGEQPAPTGWKAFAKESNTLDPVLLSGLDASSRYIVKVEVQPTAGAPVLSQEHFFTTDQVPTPGVQVNGTVAGQIVTTITGTVDNSVNAPITQAYFEFWADGDGFRSKADITSQLGAGYSPVMSEVSGLKPSTTYNVRLVTTLANGATVASDGNPFRTDAKLSESVPSLGGNGSGGNTIINKVLQATSGQSGSADGAIIKTKRLRLTPDGRAKVKVACVKGDACKGVVILATAKKGIESKRKRGKRTRPRKSVLVIGTQAFDAIPCGKEVWVNVRLSRRAQTNLKKDRKINADGYVSAFNNLASTAKASAKILIQPAQAKRTSKR